MTGAACWWTAAMTLARRSHAANSNLHSRAPILRQSGSGPGLWTLGFWEFRSVHV